MIQDQNIDAIVAPVSDRRDRLVPPSEPEKLGDTILRVSKGGTLAVWSYE